MKNLTNEIRIKHENILLKRVKSQTRYAVERHFSILLHVHTQHTHKMIPHKQNFVGKSLLSYKSLILYYSSVIMLGQFFVCFSNCRSKEKAKPQNECDKTKE